MVKQLTFKNVVETINSKDFKEAITIIGSLYWTFGQLLAPKCQHCGNLLLFVGINYFCHNCKLQTNSNHVKRVLTYRMPRLV